MKDFAYLSCFNGITHSSELGILRGPSAGAPFSQNRPTVVSNTKARGGFYTLTYFHLSTRDSVKLLFC